MKALIIIGYAMNFGILLWAVIDTFVRARENTVEIAVIGALIGLMFPGALFIASFYFFFVGKFIEED